MKFLRFKDLETKVISKTNRFELSLNERKEIRADFKNSKVLITGAAGSIGAAFVNSILNLDFKKIYLLDKDENSLTELNREINLIYKKNKIKKIEYICSDLIFFNIKKFICNEKVTHYLNFAAVKHVRSEENIDSMKYMFNTNAEKFLPFSNFNEKNYLKKVFSVSSDKAVNPCSILGVSKKLMESKLSYFKKKNPSIFVSSARFANVSFSNGSILKRIIDCISENKPIGIPRNTKRYFITHQEAANLCLKSLLKDVDGNILVPETNNLMQLVDIKSICEKILDNFGLKPIYGKKKSTKKSIIICLTDGQIQGQKKFEEFHDKDELPIKSSAIKGIRLIKLIHDLDVRRFVKEIEKIDMYDDVFKFVNKKFKNIKLPQKYKKLSNQI